jgi:integrase
MNAADSKDSGFGSLPTRGAAARLTERKALAYPTPATGYALHWCPQTPGFGVRVTANGARAWISERRVNGKTVRRTLGKAAGRAAISSDAARKLMVDISSELQRGIDRVEDQRAERAEQKQADTEAALTFEAALSDYVKRKRRGKDGLHLKERTRADYLAMVAGGRTTESGRPLADGELHALADKPLAKITADDVRSVHRAAAARGARRATYAMQVLRAVLNWHGVKVPGNPLSRDVAGKDRIILGATTGDPSPIPPERLQAWWNAASTVTSREAADFYRVMLLTGARGGELKAVVARDVDLDGARIVLRDTKNRTDHTLLLAKQTAAIVAPYLKGKRPGAKLFTVGDPRKTLGTINTAAGVSITGHDLRATFASVAEELVSAYTLKRMLNHAEAGDVTGAHYVGKSEAQLRAGWQVVADFIAGELA